MVSWRQATSERARRGGLLQQAMDGNGVRRESGPSSRPRGSSVQKQQQASSSRLAAGSACHQRPHRAEERDWKSCVFHFFFRALHETTWDG